MRKASTANMVVLILLLTRLTAWCQQDTSASGDLLTLEQAIALALHDNHLVKNAALEVGKADDNLAAARTFRLPSLHLYTLLSEQLVKQETRINDPLSNIIPGLGPFFTISAPRRPTAIFAGQVLQPLSQQYRIGLNLQQAGLARDVEGEQLRRRQQATVDELKRTYYGILQTQSALDSLQESIRLYRELDRVTGDYLAQQVALKSDSLQAEAAVQAAQAALENNARQKALQESKIAQAGAGVEAAKADIAQAEANIEAIRAEIANAQAGLAAAKADVVRTQLEKKRQEALVESASATRQKLEQVTADEARFGAQFESRKADLAKTQALLALRQAQAQQARAGLASRESELEGQGRQRGVLDAQELQLKADLRAKQGAVKVARTNLEYTRIVAPGDGIVGERKVRIGQLVSPGTQVISLVENEVWVQANYKETQLTNVSKGDAAVITVDTFPGLKLKGHVEEISPASGSQFALLPPDNASGNFTKIVQRIPVKIILDQDQRAVERLRSGMSVIVEINASGKKNDDATARKEP